MERKPGCKPSGSSKSPHRLRALRFVLCSVVASAVCGTSADQPDEILHVPVELEAGSTVIPACTPIRFVSESDKGKKVTVEGAGERWGRFEIKANALKGARFERLSDCVSATESYGDRYSADVLANFDGSEISFGMPIEFAVMALGPPDRVKWDGRTKRNRYFWGSVKPDLSHAKVLSISTEWLLRSSSVVIEEIVETGKLDVSVGIGSIELDGTVAALARSDEERGAPAAPLGNTAEQRALYDQGMRLYDQGDHAGAFSAWQSLADDGYTVAQYSLGDLYYRGEGVERDLERAVHWFREAAQGNYPFSQYQLGYLYAKGEGVSRDLVEAHRWMQAAETLGHPDAEKARKGIAKSMSPEELQAANQLFEENNVVQNPVLLVHINPDYPELAYVARVDGRVILQAVVGVDGRVEDIEVIRVNRPNLGFEEAAIEAVERWLYKPAMQGGKPVRVYFTVVVDFSLQSRRS